MIGDFMRALILSLPTLPHTPHTPLSQPQSCPRSDSCTSISGNDPPINQWFDGDLELESYDG